MIVSTTTLLLGVLFGSLGLGYFVYGRKQKEGIPLVCGLALMAVPCFTSNVIVMLVVGAVLGALPWFVRL